VITLKRQNLFTIAKSKLLAQVIKIRLFSKQKYEIFRRIFDMMR